MQYASFCSGQPGNNTACISRIRTSEIIRRHSALMVSQRKYLVSDVREASICATLMQVDNASAELLLLASTEVASVDG
jgi:hypothetical protein